MCATCGCSTDAHAHPHTHAPGKVSPARISSGSTMLLEHAVLAKNDGIANRNRRKLAGLGALALNFVSSPGAGKTTLLERTIRELGGELRFQIIEGDQATANDADRIRAAGAPAVQVNTGTGCHLDATMVERALEELRPQRGAVVAIENVGNLVCPSMFDLGEHAKVVIASVTEGEDKPLKYPHMFRASRLMLLNKIDLLPHLRFDVQRCIGYAREVNPKLEVLQLSADRGDGLAEWYRWLRARHAEVALPVQQQEIAP